MRILITGVSGTVGAHLVENLLENTGGHEIVGIQKTNRPRSTLSMIGGDSKITLEEVDIRNYQRVKDIVSYYSPDKVVHLAAQTVIPRTDENTVGTYRTNVIGTVNILEAIRSSDIEPKIIHQSTDKVFGEGVGKKVSDPYQPTKAYGTSKAAADLAARSYLESYGLDIRVVRASNIYGYESNNRRIISNTIVDCLNGNDPVLFENIKGVRQYIYSEDYAEALRLLLEEGKGVYNVSSGVSLSQKEVVEEIVERFPERGVDVQKREDWSEIKKQGLKCSEFGWKPKYSFEEGLDRTIERYRKFGYTEGQF